MTYAVDRPFEWFKALLLECVSAGAHVKVNVVTLVLVGLCLVLTVRTNSLLVEVRELTENNQYLEERFSLQQATAMSAMRKCVEIRKSLKQAATAAHVTPATAESRPMP